MQQGQNGREGCRNLEGSEGSDVLMSESRNGGVVFSAVSAVTRFERKACGVILKQD